MANYLDFLAETEGDNFGTLAIRAEYLSYDRPEVEHIWYPIGYYRRDRFERWIGREVSHTSDGRYILYDLGTPYRFDLESGGQTKACKREVVPVPKPKARSEMRWYRGHWQKYSESKGWVAA